MFVIMRFHYIEVLNFEPYILLLLTSRISYIILRTSLYRRLLNQGLTVMTFLFYINNLSM